MMDLNCLLEKEKMIIDNHAHLWNEKEYKEYFDRAKARVEKVLAISWPFENPEESKDFILSKEKLFFVGHVDVDKNVLEQLEELEELFKQNQMYGIKLYPGYQHFYPDERKIWPIAMICQKYNKPLIFHSGAVYDEDGRAVLDYSRPIHVDKLAVKFPKLKIVISHFGFPYLLETAEIVSKNKNVYTDISGTVDDVGDKKKLKNLINQYIVDLKRVFNYYPDIKEKVMFGTDFGGEHTPLHLIDPYITIVKNVFEKIEQEAVFYKTAEKVYFSENDAEGI